MRVIGLQDICRKLVIIEWIIICVFLSTLIMPFCLKNNELNELNEFIVDIRQIIIRVIRLIRFIIRIRSSTRAIYVTRHSSKKNFQHFSYILHFCD